MGATLAVFGSLGTTMQNAASAAASCDCVSRWLEGASYSRAAAPEMISVSSVVIWAWRRRLN